MGRPTELTAEEVVDLANGLAPLLDDIAALERPDNDAFLSALRRHPRPRGGLYRKSELVAAYRWLVEAGDRPADPALLERIRMKPVRTLSGVTPVTVLTKPWPCPGRCIFCPTDVRMPKSYLHDEPGAMRAEQHGFDPFEQVNSRIEAFEANGHAAGKIELLVLGGTWSSYPRDYQEWFLRRCLDAMNAGDAATLAEAQSRNESSSRRNVGLVLETRPDHVDADEIRWMRELGCTKVQMGAQSLDDRILRLNRRGHTVQQLRDAMVRLRAAGFKLVLHWMPNLHGATVASDREDFDRLWSDEKLRPDELKIYSTQLLPNAELVEYYERGEYRPYTDSELLDLILDCKERVPRYCRINRVYRDIPGPNVVEGCRLTNMRQLIQDRMRVEGRRCSCIRCREVRAEGVPADRLRERVEVYRGGEATEQFLSFDTEDDRLAGYLRLSLPDDPGRARGAGLGIEALEDAAVVREIHVYGRAQDLGAREERRSQHRGLGTRLLRRAESIARDAGYSRMAIIASVGTREWYTDRGYQLADTYMVRSLAQEVGS
jgi:elongator complex protein 3